MDTLGLAIGFNGSLDLDLELKNINSGSSVVVLRLVAAVAARTRDDEVDALECVRRDDVKGNHAAQDEGLSHTIRQKINLLWDRIIVSVVY